MISRQTPPDYAAADGYASTDFAISLSAAFSPQFLRRRISLLRCQPAMPS
jgi:hypothetical protein